MDYRSFLSFTISVASVWVSVVSLSLTVWLFFLKKNIALLISVIVFKWPILGVVFYKMAKWIDLEALPFSLGILPIILSSLIWAFLQNE